MSGTDDMRERILNGALEALAIYGTRRFSISAVSERAGISRGTLYRYYPTKDDLLGALISHMGRDFRRFLHDRLADDLDSTDRMQRVVAAMRDYVTLTPILTQLLDAEPTFVRSFYNEQFNDLVRLVESALRSNKSVSVKSGDAATNLAIAEVLVRVAMSYRIVHDDQGPLPSGQFTRRLAGILQPTTSADAATERRPTSRRR